MCGLVLISFVLLICVKWNVAQAVPSMHSHVHRDTVLLHTACMYKHTHAPTHILGVRTHAHVCAHAKDRTLQINKHHKIKDKDMESFETVLAAC